MKVLSFGPALVGSKDGATGNVGVVRLVRMRSTTGIIRTFSVSGAGANAYYSRHKERREKQ